MESEAGWEIPDDVQANTVGVECPRCGTEYQVTGALLNQMVPCDHCDKPFRAVLEDAGDGAAHASSGGMTAAQYRRQFGNTGGGDLVGDIHWEMLLGWAAVLVGLAGLVGGGYIAHTARSSSAALDVSPAGGYVAALLFALAALAAASVLGAIGSICYHVRKMSGRAASPPTEKP